MLLGCSRIAFALPIVIPIVIDELRTTGATGTTTPIKDRDKRLGSLSPGTVHSPEDDDDGDEKKESSGAAVPIEEREGRRSRTKETDMRFKMMLDAIEWPQHVSVEAKQLVQQVCEGGSTVHAGMC
jgi:hypothetical protein